MKVLLIGPALLLFGLCHLSQADSCWNKCHPKATCLNGKCKCRNGLIGDGEFSCLDACVCTAFGDPHIQTFDDSMIHFMGNCKYTIAMLEKVKDGCAFSVEMKNERRQGNQNVSWVRLVDVKIYNRTVRLGPDFNVQINGNNRALPANYISDDELQEFDVLKTPNAVLMKTRCEIRVSYDGKGRVEVVVPKIYGKQLSGICGNCDGKKNDFYTKEGKDVTEDPNRYSLIGNSYSVPDDSDQPVKRCGSTDVTPKCSKKMLEIAQSVSFCGKIKDRNDVFGSCYAELPEIGNNAYEACMFDLCAYPTVKTMQLFVCKSLENFALECQTRGFAVPSWRSMFFCHIRCGPNMEFNTSASGCQPNCLHRDRADHCDIPQVEGCVCKKGYILSGTKCVRRTECGCTDDDYNYIPLGMQIENKHCVNIQKCMMVKGVAKLLKIGSSSCVANAECGLINGVRMCICKDGFIGNGYSKCEKETTTVSSCNGKVCHSSAFCQNNRKCVCADGFHGDGVKDCYETCVCMARGESHYKLFDGQQVHFTGECAYTLSRSLLLDDPCSFHLVVERERRGGHRMKQVEFLIYKTEIRLMRNGRVFVNGERRYLPTNELNGTVRITRKGYELIVATKCKVEVHLKGAHLVKLIVPTKYKGQMTGVCGDCNGLPDDYRLRNGTDVRSEKDKFSLIGSSYRVADKSGSSQKCSTKTVSRCNETLKRKFSASNYCGPVKDTSGPFAQCLRAHPVLAADNLGNCLSDMCAEEGEKNLEDVRCKALESLAEECKERKIVVRWRTDKLCPLKCGRRKKFNPSMTGCPPTCQNRNPKQCSEPNIEGCQCKKGFILGDKWCIRERNCGCTTKDGSYLPLGKKKTTSKCGTVITCSRRGKKVVTVVDSTCHRHAACRRVEGEDNCVCNDGYEGDGKTSCDPLCGRSKQACHKLAKCVNNECMCNKGYYGDGVHVCKEKCMCKGSGDPHYYTYDKQVIHFQGPCKYTLSKSIDQNSSCSFNVEVKNEHRNSKKKVTYVKWVDVYIYGLKIRLMKNNKFQVNGINRFLPFAYKKDKLKIFTSGLSLQLVTECGIEVIFYNNHLAKIVVPPTFSGNMTGLCGNCDGKKNDFKTKNGTDVRSNRNKFNLIGESYRIPDESDSLEKTCKPSNPSECSAEEERNVVKNEFCGLLTDKTGPFKKCIESFPNQAEEAFASCKYDVCSVNAKPGDVTVCQALESFVKTCKESGIDVVWRNKTFCPLPCDVNSHFNPSMTACPATCSDKTLPDTCVLPDMEGCECDDGFLLSEDKCVKKKDCGCLVPTTGQYIPIGANVTMGQCEGIISCVATESGGKIVREKLICPINSKCAVVNGTRQCVCDDGFVKDVDNIHCIPKNTTGITSTIPAGVTSVVTIVEKSTTPPPPTTNKEVRCGFFAHCHLNAHCDRSAHPARCVCNHGYGGDGVTVCDADTCGCVASGDPHYVSFDGDSFYLLYDCKYSLSRVKSGVPGCDVKVEVKNERRPYSLHPHRTFTRLVDVYHGGHVFRMSLYKKVFRDNTPLKLPYADSSGTLSIALSGPYMKLETSCGLKVRFDGVHKAIVSLPSKLGKSALGICGNCDSDKSDDLKLLSGGRDLNAMANRTAAYEIFAQQFVVPDNSDTPSSDPRCAP